MRIARGKSLWTRPHFAFSHSRMRKYDLSATECDLYKRPDMPANFFVARGSKSRLLAQIKDIPCVLVDDKPYTVPARHHLIPVSRREAHTPDHVVHVVYGMLYHVFLMTTERRIPSPPSGASSADPCD